MLIRYPMHTHTNAITPPKNVAVGRIREKKKRKMTKKRNVQQKVDS